MSQHPAIVLIIWDELPEATEQRSVYLEKQGVQFKTSMEVTDVALKNNVTRLTTQQSTSLSI